MEIPTPEEEIEAVLRKLSYTVREKIDVSLAARALETAAGFHAKHPLREAIRFALVEHYVNKKTKEAYDAFYRVIASALSNRAGRKATAEAERRKDPLGRTRHVPKPTTEEFQRRWGDLGDEE